MNIIHSIWNYFFPPERIIQDNYFSNCPIEIQKGILDYLKEDDHLLRARRVCWDWNRMIETPECVKEIYHKIRQVNFSLDHEIAETFFLKVYTKIGEFLEKRQLQGLSLRKYSLNARPIEKKSLWPCYAISVGLVIIPPIRYIANIIENLIKFIFSSFISFNFNLFYLRRLYLSTIKLFISCLSSFYFASVLLINLYHIGKIEQMRDRISNYVKFRSFVNGGGTLSLTQWMYDNFFQETFILKSLPLNNSESNLSIIKNFAIRKLIDLPTNSTFIEKLFSNDLVFFDEDFQKWTWKLLIKDPNIENCPDLSNMQMKFDKKCGKWIWKLDLENSKQLRGDLTKIKISKVAIQSETKKDNILLFDIKEMRVIRNIISEKISSL